MRLHRCRPLSRAAVCAAGVAAVLTACSSGGGEHTESSAPATSGGETSATAAAPSDPIGISPDGVTTRIDVPAESTEEQYAQACMATKTWMEATGGDPAALVEPFLKEVQSKPDAGPVTFNKSWGELSTAQQAAVIIAVRAAAEGGC